MPRSLRRERPAGLRWAWALAMVFIWLGSASVAAEPWIAQREGAHCSRCHVNRAGGGKRTAFGNIWAATHLSVLASGTEALAAPKGPTPTQSRKLIGRILDPYLNRDIAVGGDLRVGHRTLAADQVHNSLVHPDASVYVAVTPGQVLTFYADLSMAEGSVEPREAMALLAGPAGVHVRAGWLLPPFGLRFWDDEAFTRSETGFNFAAPDLGVEVGWEQGNWAAALALTNGSGGVDTDNHKRLSGLIEYASRPLRLGMSGAFNRDDRSSRAMGGLFAGTSLGRLTLLAEADLIATRYADTDADVQALVARVEANLLVHRGVNLQLVYGYHDPNLDVLEDQRLRLRAAVEVFPVPYLGCRVVADMGSSVPQDEVGNADALLLELHGYF